MIRVEAAVGPGGANRNTGNDGETMAMGPCNRSAPEKRSATTWQVSISFSPNSRVLPY